MKKGEKSSMNMKIKKSKTVNYIKNNFGIGSLKCVFPETDCNDGDVITVISPFTGRNFHKLLKSLVFLFSTFL